MYVLASHRIASHSTQPSITLTLCFALLCFLRLDQSRIPVADLPHPQFGTITGPSCSFYSSQIFYRCSDLSDPGSIYRAVINRDLFSGSIEIFFDQLSSVTIPAVDKYRYETIKEICVDQPLPDDTSSSSSSSSGYHAPVPCTCRIVDQSLP